MFKVSVILLLRVLVVATRLGKKEVACICCRTKDENICIFTMVTMMGYRYRTKVQVGFYLNNIFHQTTFWIRQ